MVSVPALYPRCSMIHFKIILSSKPRSSMWFLPPGYPFKIVFTSTCCMSNPTHFPDMTNRIIFGKRYRCRSQWPRGIRRRSSATRLLRSWVQIPPGTWKFVYCECYVLSGRGLCDELITRPEESYRLWRIVVCDQETSKTWRLKPATGLWKIQRDGL